GNLCELPPLSRELRDVAGAPGFRQIPPNARDGQMANPHAGLDALPASYERHLVRIRARRYPRPHGN
ncbi:hypothetical protein AAVH_40104, partial [Aphelenchoides avenae]